MLKIKPTLTPVPWSPMGSGKGLKEGSGKGRKRISVLCIMFVMLSFFFFFSKALFLKLGGGYRNFWCLFMCLKHFLIFKGPMDSVHVYVCM